jgi:hypothetical protein
MVKTDGGSNMVANTFVNNIPGWDEEEQFPIEDSVPHPPIASTSGVNPPSQEVEPMVEIKVSTTDDDNENIEFEDVVAELEDMMPSTDSIPCVIIPLTGSSTGQETDYVLYSKLRSDCVAHKLQLVIKDGFKALVVILNAIANCNYHVLTMSFCFV